MSAKDFEIIAGPVPWVKGYGAVDESMFPEGGWKQALEECDSLGWRLSLCTKDAYKEGADGSLNIESEIGKNEFPIADFELVPEFNVKDINTPEYTDFEFHRMFKEYFGEFEKIDNDDIPLQFEKAKVLLKKEQPDEAKKIIRNIALSLYYEDEHKKFAQKAEDYFAGVDFDHFMAADYAAIKNDPKVTTEEIIDSLRYNEMLSSRHIPFIEMQKKVAEVEAKVDDLVPTTEKYRVKGAKNTAQYTPEREKLHIEIIEKIIEENLEKYIPKEGEKPTFILLGGRGGSGKSKFKGLVYDDHFVVLDADKIKEMLPEYEGWNAAEVHEESSDILEQAMLICQRNGLNVVVDATMDTGMSAVRRLQLYKEKGYKTEAHYMFLPPQKSAQRAIARFLKKGDKGRYVPIDALLAMKNNERNFDIIKDNVDSWSFYTGDVRYGEQPLLLASSKQEESYMGLKRSRHFFDLSEKGMQSYSAQSEEFKDLEAKIKMKIKSIKSGEKQ